MKHVTIDYGIDLGTTNSAICRMEHGTPVIIRSDSGMETMPSCISFKKGGVVRVGHSAYAELGRDKMRALMRRDTVATNSCVEFKRYMGSDMTYSLQYADHGLTPEELSARVISALCSFVNDDEVKAAVITVPAKFTVNQKDATLQAARLAGLEHVELIQEPIAASIAYGLKSTEKNGMWMVFDLGGGTLDVALVQVSDGVMQVFDTEGDNYLGGKNLDEAIVRVILLPRITSSYSFDLTDPVKMKLLTEALKVVAEKLKNKLSYAQSETVVLEAGDWGEDDDGEEVEMTFDVTRSEVEDAMRPILQKAVDVCKTLMSRNNITIGSLSHLILVGGPTYIPLLRQMLREQVSEYVETGIDPMTAVATGAAIFASTLPVKVDETDSDGDTLQLTLDFEATTVDTVMFIPIFATTEVDGLSVRMVRRADGWESALTTVTARGGLVEVDLIADSPNTFRVVAEIDGAEVRCFPSEITIVQGRMAASAILPYNIGIEVYNPRNGRTVFTSINGLEKNRPIPAKGTAYGLRTMTNLYPGKEDDVVRIAIYQGDDGAEGKSASLFEYVSDVQVTGADILSFIPADSQIDISIGVDRSEMMTVKAEFPQSGQVVEKRLDTSKRVSADTAGMLSRHIDEAESRIEALLKQVEDTELLREMQRSLTGISADLRAGAQHKQVEQHLKEVLRKLEEYETSSEWDRAFISLKRNFERLQETALCCGKAEEAKLTLDSFAERIARQEIRHDILAVKELERKIADFDYSLRQEEIYRSFIRNVYKGFSLYDWTDTEQARILVDRAMEILREDPMAPLSKTGHIAELINSMLVRDTPAQTATDRIPTDLPSM